LIHGVCRSTTVLLFCALVWATCDAHAQAIIPDAYIAEEDLQDALERGDISFDEYEQLLELFRSRTVLDQQQYDAARVPGHPLAERLALAATAPRNAPLFFYQTTIPLRGGTTESQILGIEPRMGRQSFRWEIARGNNEWHIRTARASLVYRNSSLTLGAFDTRWTGGLLSGSAPAFLKSPDDFSRTLLQPQRGRLNGSQYEWRHGHTAMTVLASERHDTALVHRTYGARVERRFGGFAFDAAYLHQMLMRRRSSGHFEVDLFGVGAQGQAGRFDARADLATNTRGLAFQGSISSHHRHSHDWQLTAWHVPDGFRHPLLASAGEPDRESVSYPELDMSLSSPSTGERGVESSLCFGRSRKSSTIAFTYWRENSDRPASLRGKLARDHLWMLWKLNGEYYVHTRSDDARRLFRHEFSARVERSATYVLVKYRLVDGSWSPFGARGVRVQAGWRARQSSSALGKFGASVSYDDFDLNKDHSAFWTLRVDQELPIRDRGSLGLHVRWRTAYAQTAPSLTVRIVSTVFL
jgi:hypothetical protein